MGRFLEHSRIYAFGVGEESRVFIASGDMMTRNTERRVEVACPIYDPRIKTRLLEMLDIMLRDLSLIHILWYNGLENVSSGKGCWEKFLPGFAGRDPAFCGALGEKLLLPPVIFRKSRAALFRGPGDSR